MTNLIISAHPDDEVLGCGGLIAKNSYKEDFYVLILTAGAEGRYGKVKEQKLRQDAIVANKLLGTKKVFFANLPNQKLDNLPIIDITQTIEKYISIIKPHRVFTHHIGDINKDHQIIAEATFTAIRPMAGQSVKELYSYNVPSSTEWNNIEGEKIFIPNVFINIQDSINKKLKAMKKYTSELRKYPHPRSIKGIKAHSKYWGVISGFKYVEPFKLIRKLDIL